MRAIAPFEGVHTENVFPRRFNFMDNLIFNRKAVPKLRHLASWNFLLIEP